MDICVGLGLMTMTLGYHPMRTVETRNAAGKNGAKQSNHANVVEKTNVKKGNLFSLIDWSS
jgi:hypothetical protein